MVRPAYLHPACQARSRERAGGIRHLEHGHWARRDRGRSGCRGRARGSAGRGAAGEGRESARRRAPNPLRMTFPIGVLVSGRGTNLQAILDACASGSLDARVVYVASNRDRAPALIRAERARVRNAAFTSDRYKTRAAAHGAIADDLLAHGAKLVV